MCNVNRDALDTLTAFRWKVPQDGYRWFRGSVHTAALKDVTKPGPLLTQKTPDGRVRASFPLRDEPGLFQRFAALPPRQPDVLDFANQAGWLGQDMIVAQDGPVQGAEPFGLWRQEIARMRRALDLWRAPGDDQKILQTLVNESLRGHVSPRLLREEDGRLTLSYVPDTLLAALWLQLARAIDGDRRYRPCPVCGRFIELSLEKTGKRADTRYCSSACRQRHWRRQRTRKRRSR